LKYLLAFNVHFSTRKNVNICERGGEQWLLHILYFKRKPVRSNF
jgi:hypothetical protein